MGKLHELLAVEGARRGAFDKVLMETIVILEDGTEKIMMMIHDKEYPIIVGDRMEVEKLRPYAEEMVRSANEKYPQKVRYTVRHYRASKIPVDAI